MCQRIISGGQSGIDRGALDACLQMNFNCGGWCPKDRLAEDGRIDTKYPLTETKEREYKYRTRLNVLHSDGTLIISPPILTGGTLLTKQIASELSAPLLLISPERIDPNHIIDLILDWMSSNQISVLNVAGPRQSEWSEGYNYTFNLVKQLIEHILQNREII